MNSIAKCIKNQESTTCHLEKSHFSLKETYILQVSLWPKDNLCKFKKTAAVYKSNTE